MKHEEATLQTKTALAASLKKFMSRKALSKITVSEIIADCNVNRKTFYYHFGDIYELLKWMLEQEAIEVVKGFDLLIDYEDAVEFAIKYVKENAHILNCAYDSMGRDALKRFFYNDFVSITRMIISETAEQNNIAVEEKFTEFLSDFVTEAIAGSLVNAFQNKRLLEREEITGYLGIIMESISDMLRRAQAHQQGSGDNSSFH